MHPRRPLAAAGLALALLLGHVRPAEAVVVERIVAIVGERAILLSELRERARPYLVAIQQKMPTGAQQAAAESQVFKELIEKMIDEELEGQAASKARVTVTAEEIDNAVQNISASQGMTPEQLYKNAKTASGMTRQEYREE